ncbi:MAG: hypothetical protein ISS78_02550 [Phycisphaerae bacterium]|nr:hypothetical protein [Phycisphaerae bacterium]
MKTTTITILMTLSLLVPVAVADESGYHPDVGDLSAIIKGKEYKFPYNFGPTGTTGWFYEREFVVNGLDAGSPADGVLKVGDRIRAVNGRRLPTPTFTDDMNDPRRIMGMGITEAETEARGGKLVVTVWRDGKEKDLTIKLPVTGSYAENWPYDCPKSARILREACQWLADNQLPNGAFVDNRDDGFALGPALNGLLLLSSGDPKYLENARRLAHNFAENPGPDPFKGDKTGTDLWGWSYQAIFVAEYYLRTGDTYVLPYLKYLQKIIMAARGPRGGWSHGFKMAAYAVGGYINPNGVSSLTALALMEDAGFEMDVKLYEGSKLYFRRWSYGGRGIHYGDHKSTLATSPQGSFGAGKNALAVVTFEVMGEPDASARFAQTIIDTYKRRDGCHAGPFFALIWGPIGASRCESAEFRLFLDYWTWFHDLSRRWDGSFLLPSANGGGGYTARGPVFTMGGQALLYALPLKKTRICGATESPFAVKDMPGPLKPIKAMVDQKRYADAAASLDQLLRSGALTDSAKRRAQLMRESVETTLASAAYTLTEIERNLNSGEVVLARTRIRNLENLLGKADEKLLALKQQAGSAKNEAIAEAWRTYQQHLLPSYVRPESYKIIQKLAKDSSAGFVQLEAREALEAIRRWPTYKDSFCAESIHLTYKPAWEKNKKDPIPLAVMRMLSFGNGILWTTWATRSALEKEGQLGEFPFSTALAPTSLKGPATWKYLTSDTSSPPKGWQEAKFDDSAWKQTKAPLLKPGRNETGPDRQWDKQFLLMRRTFDVKDTGFDSLRIKGKIHDPVDIYLNGRHVARVLQERRKSQSYIDFDISSAGLPVLTKGRNVLTVKATRDGGCIDIGLLGVKR